jgi:Domain of unknown function (DUF3291)
LGEVYRSDRDGDTWSGLPLGFIFPSHCSRDVWGTRQRAGYNPLPVVLISITRLRVRSYRYLLPFFFFAVRSSRQAKAAEGNLGVALLRDANNVFWTRTVWTTEAAMKSFMLSGPHRQAMPSLMDWCDEAAVVHWLQENDQPADWQEAYRRLRQEGRRSKVKHPTAAHEKLEFPEPVSRA